MNKRTIKIDNEEFVITKGSNEYELNVTGGRDTGRVTWHRVTRLYRGAFRTWGGDSDIVESAVEKTARQIIKTRKGVSQPQASAEIDKYLKG